jgi:hypothetical protein
MQLIVLYGLFALLGGVVTFSILLAAYKSPNEIFTFLAGGATGVAVSIMWRMNIFRHTAESIFRLADFGLR